MAEGSGSKRIGVYPGTFDPVTNGHMDIIKRACLLADRLIIAVSTNAGKGPLLTINERMSLMRDEIVDPRNGLDPTKVEVRAFDNLLMHFVEEMGAQFIIRGLRAVSDFEYEFQLASMNRHLIPSAETLFLTPAEEYSFISSSLVREIARLGGDVSGFVHPAVQQALRRRWQA